MAESLAADSIASVKAELFKAIAHPARIQPSHLSQQLALLRRAGPVATRKEGNSVIYSIKDPALTDLVDIARQILVNSLTETRDLLADLDPAR